MMRRPVALLTGAAICAVHAQASPIDPNASLANSTDVIAKELPGVLAGNGTNGTKAAGNLRGSGLGRAEAAVATLSYEGDVSLCSSSLGAQGLLLVRHSGAWGTVCDDGFGEVNAQVVCRQLGYPLGELVSASSPDFCDGSSYDILLDDVTCSGSESRLEYCTHASWGQHNCGHSEDIAVKCYSTRLAGAGATASQGRLEVYHAGEWGTVCDDSFGDTDAGVACQQLGYPFGRVLSSSSFGDGSGQIWMDDVACSGSESRLEQCAHQGWGHHNCGHSEDVAIQCWSTRLAGNGATANQGRLEVYHAGEWGTVCDDSFDSSDAQVVCRQLGFSSGVAVTSSNFGQGSGRIWLDEVACAGTEDRLEECGHNTWGEHDCSHSEDVGVICYQN